MNQAKRSERLRSQVDDATQKVALLHGEVEFNQNLVATLEKIRGLRQALELGQKALHSENLAEAVNFFLVAEQEHNSLPASQIVKVTGLLRASVAEYRHDLVEKLMRCWKAFFRADLSTTTFSIQYRMQRTQLASLGELLLTIHKVML